MSEIVVYQRPGYGTKGQKATHYVNYFSMNKYPKNAKWLKYAVEIKKAFVLPEGGSDMLIDKRADKRADTRREPKPPKIEIKRKVFRELERKRGDELFKNVSYFFDGENTLYTNKPINMKTNLFTSSVSLDDEQEEYSIPQLE
ncbi:13683_t:CDS:1, partial [Ambispora leptoticha]